MDMIGRMSGGQYIKEARLRAGLSQQMLAEFLNTSQSAIARWESGQRSPTFDVLTRAVRACGLELHVSLAAADREHEQWIREGLQKDPGALLDEMTEGNTGMDELLRQVNPGR